MKYIGSKIQYEVGDYVYLLDNDLGVNLPINQVYQIERGSGSMFYFKDKCVTSRQVRPATQQEIEQFAKPKYQIGDWVTAIKSTSGQFTEGKAYQIRGIRKEGSSTIVIETTLDDNGSTTNGWDMKFFRPATEEEIKIAQTPQFKVGDWVVVFDECRKSLNGKKLLGKTLQLLKCRFDGHVNVLLPNECKDFANEDGGYNIEKSVVRPATPEEIKAATEFKVGDWTYWKQAWYDKVHLGRIEKIGIRSYEVRLPNGEAKDGIREYCLRLATAEEIKQAQKPEIQICGHIVKIDRLESIVNIGCKRFTFTKIRELFNSMRACQITSVNIESNYKVTYSDVEKVYKEIEGAL